MVNLNDPVISLVMYTLLYAVFTQLLQRMPAFVYNHAFVFRLFHLEMTQH